jgi:hypothetical protein
MAATKLAKEKHRIDVKKSTLVVAGVNDLDDNGRDFLHRGIAARSFERRFQLANYVEVRSAEFKDALLHNWGSHRTCRAGIAGGRRRCGGRFFTRCEKSPRPPAGPRPAACARAGNLRSSG